MRDWLFVGRGMVFCDQCARGKGAEEVARKTMSKALLSAHTNDISCGAQRRSFGFGAIP